jgi:flagellar biosynthesis protein FlhG
MVKVVHLRDPNKPIWLLVNNAQGEDEAEETIEQLQAAALRFLGRELKVLGMIPADPSLLQAVREQRGVVERFPRSPSCLAFRQIADQLKKKVPLQKDGFASFWKQLSLGEL